MIIQIGIAWINSGEDHRGEEQEKLHLEWILRIIYPWTRSEKPSGISSYFYDDFDKGYARININKMGINLLLDKDLE
jgi:hypothetical protein